MLVLPLLSLILTTLIRGAAGNVTFPALPADKSTPFQQRLAVYGPNGMLNIAKPMITTKTHRQPPPKQ